jgi:hypothetical protein
MSIRQINNYLEHYLIEVSVKQLKKQNPSLETFIDELIRLNVNSKYLQWAVKKKKELGLHIDEKYLKDLLFNFDELVSSGVIDRAIKSNLIDKKTKDISYWNKKPINDFELFLDDLESVKIARRKTIKAPSGSKLVHSDNKYDVYQVFKYEASRILGAGTKWCISSKDERYWKRYSLLGNTFFFIFDKTKSTSDPIYKLAVQAPLEAGYHDWVYWNSKDKKIEYMHDYYGDDWSKLRKVIRNSIKSTSIRDIKVRRKNDDLWYGDIVKVDIDKLLEILRIISVSDKKTFEEGRDKIASYFQNYFKDNGFSVLNFPYVAEVEEDESEDQDEDINLLIDIDDAYLAKLVGPKYFSQASVLLYAEIKKKRAIVLKKRPKKYEIVKENSLVNVVNQAIKMNMRS